MLERTPPYQLKQARYIAKLSILFQEMQCVLSEISSKEVIFRIPVAFLLKDGCLVFCIA